MPRAAAFTSMCWLLPGLCALSLAPAAAAPAPAHLEASQLMADVAVLERAFGALHPGLYRYNTPEQVQAHFATLRRALSQGATLGEAYLAFSQFAAKLKCGHTYANFSNQSPAVAAALLQGPGRVPFWFRWLDRRMVITRNFSSDASLVPGTEVLSIDGIPVSEVLARLLTIARADGANDAKRMSYLQVQGEDRNEAFDVYLPLLFPRIGATQTFTVRGPGQSSVRSTTVMALTYAQRLSARREAPVPRDAPRWTFSFEAPGLGVLRMPTWALYNSSWDWRGFLQQTFETLERERTPALIIDLRGNEGGLSVQDTLLAHLIEADMTQAQVQRLVRYRRVPDDLAPYLDTWDPSFKDWGAQAVPQGDGFFRLGKYKDVIHPASPRYRGRVVVLVDAANSSATFEFAEQMRSARLGMLVGQTTGGNQRGINGGAFFFLRLPNSGIELDLPLIGQFAQGERPDAGLEPDVPVVPTQDDIAAGRDVEMLAARALLRR